MHFIFVTRNQPMNGKNYKAAIIDHDIECVDQLIRSLSAYPEITITGVAGNSTDGSALILNEQPDLVFTDIEIPGTSGINMIQELSYRIGWNMHVVFHTFNKNYLLDAIRVNAFDFLLKPYSEDEFNMLMQRWFRQLNKEEILFRNKNNHSQTEKVLLVSSGDGFRLCKVEDFVYLEYLSDRKTWTATLKYNSKVFLKHGTKSINILSLSTSFIQISQKYIINSGYLTSVYSNSCVLLSPHAEISLKISRSFLKDLKERFEGI